MRQNFIDVIKKSHVEHLIRLVENHGMHIGEFHHSALDQVDKAPRSSHDHMHALLEGPDLALYARAAVDRQNLEIFLIFGEIREIACDLKAKLSGRCYDQRLGMAVAYADTLQQRQTESRGLAGAGLSQSYDITLFRQQMGYHHFLNRHRMEKAEFLYGPEQMRSHPKVGKRSAVGSHRRNINRNIKMWNLDRRLCFRFSRF